MIKLLIQKVIRVKIMNYCVNIGCGASPTEGWRNFDNSPAIKLARSPLKYFLGKSLGLLNPEQIKYIEWLKINKIEFCDATKKIPLSDNSVKTLYSSHMFEHLSRDASIMFLNEARRVLADDGVMRIVVPDLEKIITTYSKNKNADQFMEKTFLSAPPIGSLKEMVYLFLSGYRHHQWMYDGDSLVSIIKKQKFSNVIIQNNGVTLIEEPGELNLSEREQESVIVEATK